MWSCGRCPSTAAGTTSAIRVNTSRSAATKPNSTWTKLSLWSTERKPPMNPKVLTTRWQRLPENAVLELQAEKLRHYLRHVALPFSPYYREIFSRHGLAADSIRSLSD